jgi:hypothetical protein
MQFPWIRRSENPHQAPLEQSGALEGHSHAVGVAKRCDEVCRSMIGEGHRARTCSRLQAKIDAALPSIAEYH